MSRAHMQAVLEEMMGPPWSWIPDGSWSCEQDGTRVHVFVTDTTPHIYEIVVDGPGGVHESEYLGPDQEPALSELVKHPGRALELVAAIERERA